MQEATFGIKLTTTEPGYVEDQEVTLLVPDTFEWESCYIELQDEILSAFYAEFEGDEWRDLVKDTPLMHLEAVA